MNQNNIEKQIFTYSFLFRIIFRFGNFFITVILILYSVSLITSFNGNLIFILPLFVNLLIVYFLNIHYFTLYKIMPYKIEADHEKLVCSDFFFSKKEMVIHYSTISSLSGGAFDNKFSGIMKVCDEKNDLYVGFYRKLNNSSKLVTIILSKVNIDIYNEVIGKIKSVQGELNK